MKKLMMLIVPLALIFACTGNTTEKKEEAALPDVEMALAEVQRVEAELFEDLEMNPEKGWAAFGRFRAFARNYPEHPLAPSYHMKAAAIARNIPGKALMAIKEYMDVYKKYPNDTLAVEAEFLVGFTFDQALNDKERSIKAYRSFIENHPEHPLADEARALITIRDGDVAEQVKKWKERGQ